MAGRIPNVDSKILDDIILLNKADIIKQDSQGKLIFINYIILTY